MRVLFYYVPRVNNLLGLNLKNFSFVRLAYKKKVIDDCDDDDDDEPLRLL